MARKWFGTDFYYTCPDGYEYDNMQDVIPYCYPKCITGTTRASFACSSTCNQVQVPTQPGEPIKTRNTGVEWHDVIGGCARDVYYSGVGVLPDRCTDPEKDLFIGLCYKKCPFGLYSTTWWPTTCSELCPPNTVEGGFANCTKVNSYGRGGGNQGTGCPGGYTNLGLFCYRWWQPSATGFNCPNNCTYVPIDGNVQNYPVSKGSYYYRNPNYYVTLDTNSPDYWPLNPNAISYLTEGVLPQVENQAGNIWWNTKRPGGREESCAENYGGGLCYPKCDINYVNAGCCVCSPSCGSLRDDGATCHRRWEDRGIGTIPDGCRDPDRTFQDFLCYKTCKPDYWNKLGFCTRSDCPYLSNIGGEALLDICIKTPFFPGTGFLATPDVSAKINEKFSTQAAQGGIRRIIMNTIAIAVLLTFSFILIYINLTLRSKVK